jgi:hypothetical protein
VLVAEGLAALLVAFAAGWMLGEARREAPRDDELVALTKRLVRVEVERDNLRRQVISLSAQITLDNQSGMITSDCDGSQKSSL